MIIYMFTGIISFVVVANLLSWYLLYQSVSIPWLFIVNGTDFSLRSLTFSSIFWFFSYGVSKRYELLNDIIRFVLINYDNHFQFR